MTVNIGMRAGRHHGPFGSFEGPADPYFAALNGLLIVNPRSGRGGPAADELVAAASRLGIETHVLEAGDDPAELARRADAEAIGMAGGDGSLAPVAEVAL